MKTVLLLLPLLASQAFAAGGSCPTGNTIDQNGNPISLSSLGITSCFYISKSAGNDSNAGTSESSPWAHMPGMPSCTGKCSSTTPAAGEGFILHGGDTWTSSDLGVGFAWSGTSASPIYVGVDQTWYNSSVCGSAWCRPIWNAGSAGSGDMFQLYNQSYVVLDDIEWTGMRNNQNGVQNSGGGNVRATRLYIHGWSHTGNSNNVGFFSQGGSGSIADHNVIDGSDSSQNTFNAVYSSWSQFQYNYVSYVVSGVLATTDAVHDNTFLNTVTSADGDHCNALFTFAPLSGNSQLIYNNVIANGTACPGGVVLWFNGNGSPNSSWVGYGFGNVMYNLSSNPVNIGNHGSGSYGTYYWFNNTVDCSVGGCGGTPPAGPFWTMYDNNNQAIPSALNFSCSGCTVPKCSVGAGPGCTDLTQSENAANTQGYSSTENYPYSPSSVCASSSCGTVGVGTNVSSYCTALSSINSAAGAACQYSTGAGCAYNVSNHTLTCPNDARVSRPATTAWDIGAYQFASGGCTITPTTIGSISTGQSVSQQFTASGCNASTFSISSGSLSGSGLTLSSSGLLSGTAQAGSFSFTIAYGTAADPITLTVSGATSAGSTTPPSAPSSLSATVK